mmetsp:Transcript_34061/g.85417  ORF Transcript_34061/g.85417 Transcript_34061/m.85417 type:complete len:122 (-) Transcript_34061:129-494(-)
MSRHVRHHLQGEDGADRPHEAGQEGQRNGHCRPEHVLAARLFAAAAARPLDASQWAEVRMWFENPPAMDIGRFVVADCVSFEEAAVFMKVLVDATVQKLATKASAVMTEVAKKKQQKPAPL